VSNCLHFHFPHFVHGIPNFQDCFGFSHLSIAYQTSKTVLDFPICPLHSKLPSLFFSQIAGIFGIRLKLLLRDGTNNSLVKSDHMMAGVNFIFYLFVFWFAPSIQGRILKASLVVSFLSFSHFHFCLSITTHHHSFSPLERNITYFSTWWEPLKTSIGTYE